MSVREWMFALLLAVAGALIVRGVAEFSTGAAWIAGGVLLAAWAWLAAGDVG